jgi:predicted  nucleic acid-binding Zn-ribbon protein
MLEPVQKLLALQECDLRIHDIERMLREIPARQKSEAERLVKREHVLADGEKHLKEAQSAVKQLELDVESRRERVRKLRQQQMEVKTNKEFTAIELEIKQAEADARVIEDRELAAMEAVEAVRRAFADSKDTLKTEQGFVQTEVKGLEKQAEGLREELNLAVARRKQLVPTVDPDLMTAYERVFANRKKKSRNGALDPTLVPIVDATCGGCHMKLPPDKYHSTRKPGSITTCDWCFRLLYSD